MTALRRFGAATSKVVSAPFGTDRLSNDHVATERGFAMRRENGSEWNTRTVWQRFADHVASWDECWVWDRPHIPNGGYGVFTAPGGQKVLAHRWAYQELVAPIPVGLQIDHLCRVRLCVNPSHLEVVAGRENQRRGIKGVLTTHCPQGHEYTDVNTYVWRASPERANRMCRACNRAAAARYRRKRMSQGVLK